MKFLKLCIIVFTGLAFCSSCNEDNPLPEPEPTEFTSGVFIMNAGKKDQNNASISYPNTDGTDIISGQLKDNSCNNKEHQQSLDC